MSTKSDQFVLDVLALVQTHKVELLKFDGSDSDDYEDGYNTCQHRVVYELESLLERFK